MNAALSMASAKRIYRDAVDARASDAEGVSWWSEVRAELEQVLKAPTLNAAASVIDWWHNDWAAVGDTATAAARRIRTVARQSN